jgi:DNA-binding XRE family transcriptional regulator
VGLNPEWPGACVAGRDPAAGPVALVKPVCIEVVLLAVDLSPVWAVSGSMVQDRKSPAQSGQSRISDLRSQRQADATNPSDWTQAALARKVGASVRSVKAWEAGDTVPRDYYRRRLAKALGVSVADLGF